MLRQADQQVEFLRIVLDGLLQNRFGLIGLILEHVHPVQLDVSLYVLFLPADRGQIKFFRLAILLVRRQHPRQIEHRGLLERLQGIGRPELRDGTLERLLHRGFDPVGGRGLGIHEIQPPLQTMTVHGLRIGLDQIVRGALGFVADIGRPLRRLFQKIQIQVRQFHPCIGPLRLIRLQ